MIFPDRIEMGFWRIWRNYAIMILIGFCIAVVVMATMHLRTDWLDQLRRIINGW